MVYAENLIPLKVGLINDFSLCVCLSTQFPDNFAEAGNSGWATFDTKSQMLHLQSWYLRIVNVLRKRQISTPTS
tara:strand:- start:243 stop:464 length:222 start_codon:yes stop_codon:yes gene_type:complete